MMSRDELRGPLGVSLAALACIVIIGLWLLAPLLGAVTRIGGGAAVETDRHEGLIALHDESHATDLDRVLGRSFFFDPPAPPRPKPPEPTGACCVLEECTVMRRDGCRDRGGQFQGADSTCDAGTCEPREAPKPVEVPKVDPRPKRYGGPDIIAIYGTDVLFRSRDGLMIVPVGRTMNEIQVVAVNAPSSAELMWKDGGPFTVPLIDQPDEPFADSGLEGVIELPTTSPTRTVDEDRPGRMATP